MIRNRLIIEKQALLDLYGGKLMGYRDLQMDGNTLDLSGLLADKLEVRLLATVGPFSTVSTLNTTSASSRFIVPTSLIQKEQIEDSLTLFRPILDRYYKDHWSKEGSRLYIHYPKLVIKNSLDQSHTIEDLLVRFSLESNGYIANLQGVRCSWTAEEIKLRYNHSHLSGHPGSGWDTFCMGSGTPFAKFYEGLKKVTTPQEFELFLIQLEQYLSWESLEGTPYVSISGFFTPQEIGWCGPSDFSGLDDLVHGIALDWMKLPKFNELIGGSYPYYFDPTYNSSLAYSQELDLVQQYNHESRLNEYLFDWDPNAMLYVESDPTTSNSNSTSLPSVPGLPSGILINPRLLPSIEIEKTVNTVKRFCPTFLARIVEQINLYLLNGIRNPISTEGSAITS